MQSKFPFSMENIPRQTSFACLSLKFGSIISALIVILYSVLSLAQCLAALGDLSPSVSPDDMQAMLTYAMVVTATIFHSITLFLTALMLVGTLREKAHLMRPWVVWTSMQVLVYVVLFVFYTTISMVNHMDESSLLIYVLQFLSLMARFYMLMLVASYYKQLEDERDEGEKLKSLVNSDMWYNTA